MRPPGAHVSAGRATLGQGAPSVVGIGIEVWLDAVHVVTNPSKHTKMFARVYVTHQPVKATVTFGRPACNMTREVTDRTEQVKAR